MPSILIIDDNEDLRELMAGALRVAGYAVDAAADGNAALTLFRSKAQDLVITDIVMPDKDGIELIGELRHMSPRPLVIAMSGGSKFRTSLPTAKRLGVERILAKPIRPEVLLSTVANVLKLTPQRTVPRLALLQSAPLSFPQLALHSS